MLRGLFVTGTDTNVGKTVTCAALLHRYGREFPLRYWKPVQTGFDQDDDSREIERLGWPEVSAGLRLPRAVSPHLAARWAGVSIKLEDLQAPGGTESLIVEGAGGVLVPLNETALMIDLMRSLGLPVVVVARSSLGTINHTLLTLEALRARSLCVAGVVMVGAPDAENRAAIEHYGRARVLGEMPRFEMLRTETLREWACAELDPDGTLAEFLR